MLPHQLFLLSCWRLGATERFLWSSRCRPVPLSAAKNTNIIYAANLFVIIRTLSFFISLSPESEMSHLQLHSWCYKSDEQKENKRIRSQTDAAQNDSAAVLKGVKENSQNRSQQHKWAGRCSMPSDLQVGFCDKRAKEPVSRCKHNIWIIICSLMK